MFHDWLDIEIAIMEYERKKSSPIKSRRSNYANSNSASSSNVMKYVSDLPEFNFFNEQMDVGVTSNIL